MSIKVWGRQRYGLKCELLPSARIPSHVMANCTDSGAE